MTFCHNIMFILICIASTFVFVFDKNNIIILKISLPVLVKNYHSYSASVGNSVLAMWINIYYPTKNLNILSAIILLLYYIVL